jgi:hypothetical protein
MPGLTLPVADAIGVIRREMRVRLLDISMSGCLLEADAPLRVGDVGTLLMVLDALEYHDGVRVTRCDAAPHATGRHHLGVQFLWTDVPPERSIRRAAGRIRSLGVSSPVAWVRPR